MANVILWSGLVCDGFDALVSIAGAEPRAIHFVARPADVQAAVDQAAAAIAAAEPPPLEIVEAIG